MMVKRVLQLGQRHSDVGGADVVMDTEARLLESRGVKVRRYLLPPVAEMSLTSIKAARLAIWNDDAAAQVAAMCREWKPDIVHAHNIFPLMSPSVLRAATRTGCRTVLTAHHFLLACIASTLSRKGQYCDLCVGRRLKLPGVRYKCYRSSTSASAALTTSVAVHRALGSFERHLDAIIVLSELSKAVLVREGIHQSKIHVKPNSCTDPGKSGQYAEQGSVTFVGRLVEAKGIRVVLDAWQELEQPWELHIVGDGPLLPLVEDRARRDSRIRVFGWQNSDRISEVLRHSALTVVPSLAFEAGPTLALIQSLAHGVPLVVADGGNLPVPLLSDGAGWSFTNSDSRSLAEVVAAVMENSTSRRLAHVNARRSYLRRYSDDANLSRLLEVYGVVDDVDGEEE